MLHVVFFFSRTGTSRAALTSKFSSRCYCSVPDYECNSQYVSETDNGTLPTEHHAHLIERTVVHTYKTLQRIRTQHLQLSGIVNP